MKDSEGKISGTCIYCNGFHDGTFLCQARKLVNLCECCGGYHREDFICSPYQGVATNGTGGAVPNNLKPMTNNTHPLADLKAGDYLKDEKFYRRVLSDIQHPELGELATVLVSLIDKNIDEDDLKEASGWETLFELQKYGWNKLTVTSRTIDDVLATLSEEDRKIVEEKIK